MATVQEIDRIMENLAAAFPDWNPPSVSKTLQQYEDALAKYPADLLERACKRCRDSCFKFPAISDINKAIREIRETETKPPPPDSPKTVPSDEVLKMLDDFRDKMVREGKWKDNGKYKYHTRHR